MFLLENIFILAILVLNLLASCALTFSPSIHLKVATPCNITACKLPTCRCSGTALPIPNFEGKEQNLPQFVTVTFDDAVTALNYVLYQELFANLRNINNCSARATFFVTHEYTDYSKVHSLAMEGHEIALHSITHGNGSEYWLNANRKIMLQEFGGQIKMLETFAYIPRNDIRGLRLPYLQQSGNTSYVVAKKLRLLYDSSWPTQQYNHAGMWPYTLDYKSAQDCQIGPCPQASIPGIWVNPMITWTDTKGYSCAMLDACVFPPSGDDEDGLVTWMLENFNRHYEGKRAPFGVYMHAAWFERGEKHFSAMRRFLKMISALPMVQITTMSKVMQYMQNPELGLKNLGCPKASRLTKCIPRVCPLLKVSIKKMRFMTICGRCPTTYPWLGNPLGKPF